MKKILFIIFCSSQIACSTPSRMTATELASFKYDCSQREDQYKFLESQKYTQDQRLITAFGMTSILGIVSNWYNGTSQDSYATMRGEHEVMIKHKQRILREQCRTEDYTKWQRTQNNLATN